LKPVQLRLHQIGRSDDVGVGLSEYCDCNPALLIGPRSELNVFDTIDSAAEIGNADWGAASVGYDYAAKAFGAQDLVV